MKDQFITSVQTILLRDLDKLAKELSQYETDEALWKIAGDIKNPAGNLALHLCGNLQHYIGAVLGKTEYIRNRDKEFSDKGLSRDFLLSEIERAKKAIGDTLPALTEQQLMSDYPEEVFGYPMKTSFFLMHLSAHLGYHLGQVNYHRRLVR